jgi:hypothetical protein
MYDLHASFSREEFQSLPDDGGDALFVLSHYWDRHVLWCQRSCGKFYQFPGKTPGEMLFEVIV